MVKMFMKIDPLPMRGSMVMISPSRREVSPAEQLRRSPRLVPPRFCLVAAEFRPVSLLMIFSRVKSFIQHKMGTGGPIRGPGDRGTPSRGGGALHPHGRLGSFLTCTPSPLDHVCSKNHSPEGFIPFGLRLIFLFFEILK